MCTVTTPLIQPSHLQSQLQLFLVIRLHPTWANPSLITGWMGMSAPRTVAVISAMELQSRPPTVGFRQTGSVISNPQSADSPYETETGAQKMRISRLGKTTQFDQIKDRKVYIALSARCERGSFHPTLLICVDKQRIEGKG